MTLIKSISGIRGTIGGKPGVNLTPLDVVKFAAAFGSWLLQKEKEKHVVIGRDARLSGEMVSNLISSVLSGLGIKVTDIGLSTTPTVEIAVPMERAGGGIIITASHNPGQWNALKLLNDKGEFVSDKDGAEILDLAAREDFDFCPVLKLGKIEKNDKYLLKHIEQVVSYPLVDKEAISRAKFKVAVDGINSSGGIAIPQLLRALGVEKIEELHCVPTGHFSHNPEPVPENLSEICATVKKGDFDLGIVVDPDVDRLVLICEDGTPFSEEYTLVAVADYFLQNRPGPTVSNLSSSRALQDITEKYGCTYHASAVGEVNVVEKMKEVSAVIGGEGNGGIIVPDFHYGRDALIGVALILTHLAKSKKSLSRLKLGYPVYHISKTKIELDNSVDLDGILKRVSEKYKNYPIDFTDGVKIHFDKEWVHLRRSNTEPIVRIISESGSEMTANTLGQKLFSDIKELMNDHGKDIS